MTDALDLEHIDPTAADPLDCAFNAEWLTSQTFPPLSYTVPGLIPEGLTVLVAAPKVGKSWFVLDLAHAAATGGTVLGSIQVQRRPVLYLALEDGPRRLQDRLRVLDVESGSSELLLITRPSASVPDTIAAYLNRYGDRSPLVILDTLGRARRVYGGNDAYGRDYSDMGGLKELVDRWPGSALVVVHHTRKGEPVDFLDAVSGTQGIAGAADTVILFARARGEESGKLSVTSRDARDGVYAVTHDNGRWRIVGDSLAEAAAEAEKAEAVAGVGDDMAAVVDVVSRHPEGIRPKDVAAVLHWDDSRTRVYLKRAYDAGRIMRPKLGTYTPKPPVTPVAGVTEGEDE
ncbi:AAA family ATPase [Micrococcus lylae]|uniref:AAA family ATPase n=1 Tax=Micrococcus lylae TaxID=1273 RepID=UPI003EC1040D